MTCLIVLRHWETDLLYCRATAQPSPHVRAVCRAVRLRRTVTQLRSLGDCTVHIYITTTQSALSEAGIVWVFVISTQSVLGSRNTLWVVLRRAQTVHTLGSIEK